MPTRRPLLAGNWKMQGTRAEAQTLLSALKAQLADSADAADREVVVAPPFTALETAARILADSAIRLAAQDLHWEPQGAFTGEISGPMLQELDCHYVIVGHSERRQYCGETDEIVARKVQAAQRDGLVPIVCVGETLEERERGETSPLLPVRFEAGCKAKTRQPSLLLWSPMNQSGLSVPVARRHQIKPKRSMPRCGRR